MLMLWHVSRFSWLTHSYDLISNKDAAVLLYSTSCGDALHEYPRGLCNKLHTAQHKQRITVGKLKEEICTTSEQAMNKSTPTSWE